MINLPDEGVTPPVIFRQLLRTLRAHSNENRIARAEADVLERMEELTHPGHQLRLRVIGELDRDITDLCALLLSVDEVPFAVDPRIHLTRHEMYPRLEELLNLWNEQDRWNTEAFFAAHVIAIAHAVARYEAPVF